MTATTEEAPRTARIRSDHSVVTVSFGTATHPGNHRTLNEDSLCASSPVFMVADGMGGHASGEIASALAAGAVGSLSAPLAADSLQIRATVAEANRIIYQRSGGAAGGMGTTITGLVVAKWATPLVAVVNVGDSRTYCWAADTGLTQVTTDHSQVQELIDAGLITVEEAATHPDRNIVTRALGIEADVEIDIFLVPVVIGQRWLACSDGLTGELASERIAAILAQGDAQTAATALVDETVAGPARDNVTVVVVDIVGIELLDDLDRTDPRGGLDVTAPNPRTGVVNDRSVPPSLGEGLIDDVPVTTALPPPSAAPPGVLIDGVPELSDVLAPNPNEMTGE